MEEYHLVIIWNYVLNQEKEILSMLQSKFEIIGKIMYRWDEDRAHENFSAFYGERLDNIDYKVKHCGAGPFEVILIKDYHAQYTIRKTTSGDRQVNANVFDMKQKMREATGGGHRIHATDDQNEVNQNMASLFGKSLDEMIPEFQKGDKNYNRNVSGINGWNSWKEMFETLNIATTYVVLRNYETMEESLNQEHGDTDILVKDLKTAATLMLAKPKYRGKNRVAYEVTIAGKSCDIDLRFLGDGYYFDKFEEKILNNREYSEKWQCYIQGEETLKYSLLYHGMVHKQEISQDYMKQYIEWFGTKEIEELQKELEKYLVQNEYKVTAPKDWSVYINPIYFSQIEGLNVFRKTMIKCLKKIRELKGK